LSEAIEALLSFIAGNPRLFLIVLGFLAILIGWAFGAGWIIAIGFVLVMFGIITKKSRGEWKQSPVH